MAERRIAAVTLLDRWLWRAHPTLLLREMLGNVNETYRMVNLSDGGLVDNLGAFELLRRRCTYIICSDSEVDPDGSCRALIALQRRAEEELGIEIEISLDALRPAETGLSRRRWAVGRIRYPAAAAYEPRTGYLLYVKPALTGDEDYSIHEQRARSPAFPHETTAHDHLEADQFTAYRALGDQTMAALLSPESEERSPVSYDFGRFRKWFQGLEARFAPRPRGIFICYRRADASGHALLAKRALSEHFGADQVFMDIGGIEPGTDFTQKIDEALDSCTVVLVLIGNQWLTLSGEGGKPRLDDPDDHVRGEVLSALDKRKRVIPLLVEQAPMPRRDELPEPLQPLAYQNAVNLTHDRFDSDLETLVRILDVLLEEDPRAA